MADETTETAATGMDAEKKKKLIKTVLIAALIAVALWFVYKKFLK